MDDKRRISLFFFILVLIFFYLPIVMLVVLSFNNSRGFSWDGFSLKWYIELFINSPDLWEISLLMGEERTRTRIMSKIK